MVLLSVLSINCIIIAGFIISSTILAWNIDIWDPAVYQEWDYLTTQHLYMEIQIGTALVEILLDIISGCCSYNAVDYQGKQTGKEIKVKPARPDHVTLVNEDDQVTHKLSARAISTAETSVEEF